MLTRFTTLTLLACTLPLFATPFLHNAWNADTIFLGPIADQDWARPIATGDLDGDGYDEIIVSASESYGDVISRVYIMRGESDAHIRGTVDLTVDHYDQEIIGAQLNDNLGCSMVTGDVNGDGYQDLLLCASGGTYSSYTAAGIAYLIFGGPDFFDEPLRSLADSSNWDARIVGPVSYGDMGGSGAFGGMDTNAAAIGNLDGDEKGDIVLGVHLANGASTQSGLVYTVFGRMITQGSTRLLSSIQGYSSLIIGKGQYDELGDIVLTGDITGDGIDELIIPNQNYSQALFGTEGAVHIFRGGSLPRSHNLASSYAPITLLGDYLYDKLGENAIVGDFDGDGTGDLLSAAPGADVGEQTNQTGDGYLYGLLGSSDYQTGSHIIDYATATPDFLIIGEYQESLGTTMAAGDFNGDGITDIAAGERFSGPATNGSIDILFGMELLSGQVFHANVSTHERIEGNASDRCAFWLTSGDSNNDGIDEILYGVPFNNNSMGTVWQTNLVNGDSDADGDIDLKDYAEFQNCFDVPAVEDRCYLFDFNTNGIMDTEDFAALEKRLHGPAN